MYKILCRRVFLDYTNTNISKYKSRVWQLLIVTFFVFPETLADSMSFTVNSFSNYI